MKISAYKQNILNMENKNHGQQDQKKQDTHVKNKQHEDRKMGGNKDNTSRSGNENDDSSSSRTGKR
jgi:hypothetical protein